MPFSVRCDICRFNRAISLLFFPSSFSQPFPVLFSSSHLIVSLESSLRSRISRRNAVVLSSFAPRARDADAVCRTRAFAFSLQVTEHSIEPGRTVPSGTSSAELSCSVLAHTLSSIPPFPPRFLSTSRFSGSYANATKPLFHSSPRRPTRIENQFRKTVINGRQSVRSILLAHAVPHCAACGNRAAFE